ncbi:MAG: RES family NAD+ phosphorylase [Bacteroidia bacterium]
MMVYRISRERFARDLTGEGAKLHGGRWNIPGFPCIYTASSRSLAMLEFRVHLHDISQTPPDLRLLCLEVPERSVTVIDPELASPNWRNYPSPGECMRYGAVQLLKQESLLIKVPSSIVPEEYNILINPLHPKMKQVKIVDCLPLLLDPRLFK